MQSRYYDSVTHRFINADSYQSTGQGIIGTNMFAYCNNDPVNTVDPYGDDPWWLLPYWGYIHKAVQEHILLYSGRSLEMEQKVNYDVGYGKVDIYDPSTNEMWEVKSSGPASLLAVSQLNLYCSGTIDGTDQNPTKGAERFHGIFDKGIFRVAYWSTSPGVILYKFWVRNEIKVAAAATAAVAVAGSFVMKKTGSSDKERLATALAYEK